MKISIDGLRTNMSHDLVELRDAVLDLANEGGVEGIHYDELVEKTNKIISNTNILCLIYDESEGSEINKLDDRYQVPFIEGEDEDEDDE